MSLLYFAQDGEHQQIEFEGAVLSVLFGSDTTGGQVSVIRTRVPGGFAPPVHVHYREDEMYVLLEGSAIFWAGDTRQELLAGGATLLPRNLPHAIRITSQSADVLIVCTPAGIERFFRTIGWDPSQPKPDGWAPTSPEGLAAAAAEHGQRILGPPLGEHDMIPAALLQTGI